jgi:hypothetical protein
MVPKRRFKTHDVLGNKLFEPIESDSEDPYSCLTVVDLQEILDEIKKPIPRNIDIRLRICLIKKQLRFRNDLTANERRALQSRKNTCLFRVKCMDAKTA